MAEWHRAAHRDSIAIDRREFDMLVEQARDLLAIERQPKTGEETYRLYHQAFVDYLVRY